MPKKPIIQPTFKAKFKWVSNASINITIGAAMIAALVVFGKAVSDEAKRNHPYIDRTGENTESIGWLLSLPGGAFLGDSRLRSAEDIKVSITPGLPMLIIGTSSGYGGYLEIGTRKMPAFPYILPAIESKSGMLSKLLKGII